MQAPARFLRQLFDRAVEVADPMRSLARVLPPKPEGRVLVIGAGKASARMAEAVEAEGLARLTLVLDAAGELRPLDAVGRRAAER